MIGRPRGDDVGRGQRPRRGRGSRVVVVGLGLACALAAASGCSSSHAAQTIPAPISTAIDRLQHETFHSEVKKTTTVTGSSLPTPSPSPEQKLVEDVESPARIASVLSTTGRPDIHLVTYDGKAYVSTDGTTFLEAPALQKLFPPSPQLAGDVLQHLTDFSAKATGMINGVTADRYDASLDPAYLPVFAKSMQSLLQAQLSAPAAGTEATAQIHWKGTTFSYFVEPAGGQLVGDITTSTAAIDVAAYLHALTGTSPSGLSGTLQVTSTMTTFRRDFGSSITVKKPTATGAASPQDLARIFG